MEHLKCPICGKSHLLKLSGINPYGKGRVVCENEDFFHVIKNGKHLLGRTPKNVLEELEQTISAN